MEVILRFLGNRPPHVRSAECENGTCKQLLFGKSIKDLAIRNAFAILSRKLGHLDQHGKGI